MTDTDRQPGAVALSIEPPLLRPRLGLAERFRALALPWRVVAVAVALEALLVGLHGINKVVFGDGAFLALDAERNLPTWFSASLFALAGASWLVLAAFLARGRRFRVAIGALMLALSLDEAAEIHDRVEDLADFRVAVLGWEPVLAVAVIFLFVQVIRRSGPRARVLLTCGVGALGLAQFTSALNGTVDFFYAGEVALSISEEWLEMLTATFLLGGAIDALPEAVAGYPGL
jgi:hypothetical protein